MKRFIILLGITFGLSLQAQNTFHLGAKLGANINQLSTSLPDYSNDNYMGFNVGLFSRINFERFHIQPELYYSHNGGNMQKGVDLIKIRTHSMNLPILLGYKILDFEQFNLRLNAGPYVSYAFYQDIESNVLGQAAFTRENMNNLNVGVIGGIGVDIWRITIDARYNWGLMNVLGDNKFVGDPSAGFRNSWFEFAVGFRFL